MKNEEMKNEEMRVIAFYLPQFHAIPENDEWWGKGFTDWDNVRKARPLFAGHQQPRQPLNGNYYDLTQTDPLRWQARLASEYHIYGFCFYHYWFHGKLLLEKPAELLLANKDIETHYCFSWANEPWARTWDGKAHQVLIAQEYGNRQEWVEHFNYLLPFFQDSRYIKEDNSPMFLIYKTSSIPCAQDMMACWNELARKAGFNGIHFVETLRDGNCDKRPLPIKARVEFEPIRTNIQQHFLLLNYKRIRRRLLRTWNAVFHSRLPLNRPFTFAKVARRSVALSSPEGTYGGVFVGWDNTPRRQLAGTVVLPPTKEEFKEFVNAKIQKTVNEYHTRYLFVNAWNEWAEGTVLEPDETHRYEYLEAIKEATT
jgi:lipopolysaccharide biosynthesis protein